MNDIDNLHQETSLLRNIVTNYLGAILDVAIILILTPIILDELGSAAYGVWILLHSILFYLKFLDLGLYDATVKYIAEFLARNEVEKVNKLIGTTISVFIFSGVIAMMVCLLIATFIVPLFEVPDDLMQTLKLATLIIGLDLIISFPASVFDGIIEGHQRYDILNYSNIGFSVFQAVATVILLTGGYGIISLLWLEVVTTILGMLVDLIIIRKYFPLLSLTIKFDKKMWWMIRGYTLWNFVIELVTDGSEELAKLIIPFFMSVSLITPFAIVYTLANMIIKAVAPIVDVLFPLSSALDASADQECLQKLVIQASRAVTVLSLPAALYMSFFGEAIIGLWLGEDVIEIGPVLIPIVMATFFASAYFWPASSILMGMGKVKPLLRITIVEIIFTAIMIGLTVRDYQLIGLAGSICLSTYIVHFGLLLPLISASLNVSGLTFIYGSLLKPAVASLPLIVCCQALYNNYYTGSWLILLLDTFLLVLLYIASFYIVGTSLEEKKNVFQYCRRVLA